MFGELFLDFVAHTDKDFRINGYFSLKMLQHVITRMDIEEKNLRERRVGFQPECDQRHEEATSVADSSPFSAASASEMLASEMPSFAL